MKNNLLILVGFAVICLVNLTGTSKTKPTHLASTPHEMKLADTGMAPSVSTAQKTPTNQTTSADDKAH